MAKEVQKAEKLAKMDPADYPATTRAGWEAKANAAREGLPKLKAEYREALQEQSVAVFLVDGPHSNRFMELAKEEGVELVADASQFYRDVAKRVLATMGGSKEFTSDQYGAIIRSVTSEARALGFKDIVVSTSQPFTSFHADGDRAVLRYVRGAVRRIAGDRINNELVARALTAAGLASEDGQKDGPVPVLVHGLASEEEARAAQVGLPCGISRVANPASEPTADDVVAYFKQAPDGAKEDGQKQGEKGE